MIKTKTDEELKNVSEEATNDNVEQKKKKKKKYTVEELLNSDVELVDEYGRRRKVTVKTHQSFRGGTAAILI